LINWRWYKAIQKRNDGLFAGADLKLFDIIFGDACYSFRLSIIGFIGKKDGDEWAYYELLQEWQMI
jgi:hypothetical protein